MGLQHSRGRPVATQPHQNIGYLHGRASQHSTALCIASAAMPKLDSGGCDNRAHQGHATTMAAIEHKTLICSRDSHKLYPGTGETGHDYHEPLMALDTTTIRYMQAQASR